MRQFLNGIEGQAAKMSRRLTRGQGFDTTWQAALHTFCRELLPGPILDELRRRRTVVVVPHHVLHHFPFAALVVRPDVAETATSSRW